MEEVKAKRIDLFKKYLGPSFKEEWEGASTIISNQQSYIDIGIMVTRHFPTYVVDYVTSRTLPGISQITDAMNCIYFSRFGTKENKKECLKNIIEYQSLVE